jgi:hypothetical protein
MKHIKLLILALCMLPIFCNAQIKTNWEVVELVSSEGKSFKKWNTNSSVSFIDSILIISCDDNKILGLISNPQQGFFDDSGYRVFKLVGPIQSIADSIGTIYRRAYTSTFYLNDIVMLVDDSLDFVLIHPNAYMGIVFHNKKTKQR